MNNRYYQSATSVIFLITLTLLTSACTDHDMSDLTQFVAQARIKHKGQVEPLPVITPYDSYSYRVENKRDPFQQSVALIKSEPVKHSNSTLHPNEARNKEALENFPLESLFMVGVMKNNGENWAIIKAPDGSIYKVKKGNYMGQNHGKITKITDAKISLKEIVADGMGGWKIRHNSVGLSQ